MDLDPSLQNRERPTQPGQEHWAGADARSTGRGAWTFTAVSVITLKQLRPGQARPQHDAADKVTRRVASLRLSEGSSVEGEGGWKGRRAPGLDRVPARPRSCGAAPALEA